MEVSRIYLVARYTFEDYNDSAPSTAESGELGKVGVKHPDDGLWAALEAEYDSAMSQAGMFRRQYEPVDETMVIVAACRRRAVFVFDIPDTFKKLSTKHSFQLEGARKWDVSFQEISNRMSRNDSGWCVSDQGRVSIFAHSSKVTPAMLK